MPIAASVSQERQSFENSFLTVMRLVLNTTLQGDRGVAPAVFS
jgi:hypothetical protein